MYTMVPNGNSQYLVHNDMRTLSIIGKNLIPN